MQFDQKKSKSEKGIFKCQSAPGNVLFDNSAILKYLPEKQILIVSLRKNQLIGLFSLKQNRIIKIITNEMKTVRELRVWDVFGTPVITACGHSLYLKQLSGLTTFKHKTKSQLNTCVFLTTEGRFFLGGLFPEVLSLEVAISKVSVEFIPKNIRQIDAMELFEPKSLIVILEKPSKVAVYDYHKRTLMFDLTEKRDYFAIQNIFIPKLSQWPVLFQVYEEGDIRVMTIKSNKEYQEKNFNFGKVVGSQKAPSVNQMNSCVGALFGLRFHYYDQGNFIKKHDLKVPIPKEKLNFSSWSPIGHGTIAVVNQATKKIYVFKFA